MNFLIYEESFVFFFISALVHRVHSFRSILTQNDVISLAFQLLIDKKENESFLVYKEIQIWSVAKSYMRKGFLIYEEMRKYLTIYKEAVSHIWLCNRSLLKFFKYEENSIFFFISACFPNFHFYSLIHFWQNYVVFLKTAHYLMGKNARTILLVPRGEAIRPRGHDTSWSKIRRSKGD